MSKAAAAAEIALIAKATVVAAVIKTVQRRCP
jgi:hypothetical protein